MPITKEQLSKLNRRKAYKRIESMTPEELALLQEKQRQGMKEYWRKWREKRASGTALNTIEN